MTPAAWASVRQQFERACDLRGAEREAFLESITLSNPEMAAVVRQLVEASESAGGFLVDPPWKIEPRPQPQSAFSPGQVLAGRFVVEEMLGAGGAGEVYRAFDRHRKMRVAVKTMRAGILADETTLSALRNELNMASLVSHRSVCRLYDLTLPPVPGAGAAFISMELLEGETLSERIRRGRLSVAEAAPITEQIAQGLAAAHDQGIVHRDLKSGNVMLVAAEHGVRAVITDFGLARETKPNNDLSTMLSANSFAGTPAYMAPEQLQGKPAAIASDIHAFGVVMFEMVTGRLPFQGETPLVIASARLNGSAPRARSLAPDLDRRWDAAIHACLERDPSRRPPSALAVVEALEGPAPRMWPRRMWLSAGAASLAGGVYFLLRPLVSHVPDPQAELAFQRGIVFSQRRSPEGIMNAIQEFRRAVEIDPAWAEAWAQLSTAYASASNFAALDPAASLRQARVAADRAIQLKPSFVKAYGALAQAQALDFAEWPNAEQTFRRAIQLDPADADLQVSLAAYLRKKGRFREAETHARKSIELSHQADPRAWTELCFIFFTSGDWAQLMTQTADQVRLFPTDALSQYMLSRALELNGRFDEALAALDYADKLQFSPQTSAAQRALILAAKGDRATAQTLVAKLEALLPGTPIDGLLVAGVYTRLGEPEKALSVLEDAYRRQDNTLLSLATSPFLWPLRAEPRFVELRRRLQFTDQIMQQMEFKPSSGKASGSQPI